MPNFTQSQVKAKIQELIDRYRNMSDTDRKTTTEASVVHQFIDPLLEALGWPIRDPARYKYELATQAGRPDMTLLPEKGGLIFVEAKRFGKIEELAQARKTITGIVTPGQLALPGMATDRTAEEQQAINYAFQNGGTWAVLTNFEKLRLFNARRDWLVLSFETPSAFLDQFDLLWQLSYESVINGELDRLSNQRHREDVDTDYLNFINDWREKLAQDIITLPEANPWAFNPDGSIRLAELRAVVQRILDRLVVVRFAEDHLIAPPGALYSLYEIRTRNPYTFTLAEFFARLYRRFDELHNSALFAPHLADQAVFSDEVLGGLIHKLYEARYRAMSADIMGNTYEQYLGKTLAQVDGTVTTRDNLETRKKQGSYYTPQVIVRYLVDHSLGRYLYGTANGRPDGEPSEDESCKTAAEIRTLRILDPASGSGSFLIYAYQVLAEFYRSEIKRLEHELAERTTELAGSGLNPIDIRIELAPLRSEHDRLQEYPRLILERHLYGVDLDPQAAEIATVNLIMRAMADQRGSKKRLPLILNQNVKVGNALMGAGPDDPRLAEHAAELAELRRLRRQLLSEIDTSDHSATMGAIIAVAGRINTALDESLQAHFDDPIEQRPFNWAVEFPEVFVDEWGQPLGNAGFQVVIGNPPWEIVKPDYREYYAQFDPDIESRMTRRKVEARVKELNAAAPKIESGWLAQKARIEAQASYYKKSDDFTRQGRGDTATHKLFLERAYSLLADEGRLGYVIPSGIYTDLGTKQLREMLLNEGQIEFLFGLSNERFFFSGVHHAFKFVLLGTQKGNPSDDFLATFRINPRVSVAPRDLTDFLANSQNLISVKVESLKRFSPDSLVLMEYETSKDYVVAEKIYDGWPLLGDDDASLWQLEFKREFDMANDSRLFNQHQLGLPLYEGKLIHQFDAHFAEPRFWIEEPVGQKKLANSRANGWYKGYRFAFREVSGAVNERTCLATVLPPNTFAGHTLWVGVAPDDFILLYYVAMINSFCLDWITRFKVNFHVTLFIMKSLPLPRLTAGNPYFDAIVPRAARLTCTTPEFADLWQEVMSEPWDESKAATAPAERQHLRDELDALVAHLYGLDRDDFAHILGTFPLVFPNTPEGKLKKETLLGVYDRFGDVTRGWPR